jgi:hypothetical protein
MSASSSLLLGAVAGAVLLAAPALAEEQTVSAFSVWQVEGALVQTGEQSATFAGVLEGTVYVETERGPVAAGTISCPATVEVALDTGRQSGLARCAFLAGDDSRLFADLRCDGVHLVGCSGTFDITGGSGRFAGVQGQGPVIVRGDFRSVSLDPSGALRESVSGIMYWPELTYTLP